MTGREKKEKRKEGRKPGGGDPQRREGADEILRPFLLGRHYRRKEKEKKGETGTRVVFVGNERQRSVGLVVLSFAGFRGRRGGEEKKGGRAARSAAGYRYAPFYPQREKKGTGKKRKGGKKKKEKKVTATTAITLRH